MSDYSPAISDVWREIRSADPGCELAHLLTAARTMAQTLIPGVDVAFSGMDVATTDRKVIYTTARDFDQYPVPGHTVDKFLGWVVHEAGHCLFSPDKRSLIKQVFRSTEENMPDLVNVIEDVYINHLLSAFPVYRDYLMSAMSQVLTEEKLEMTFQPLKGECLRLEMINALMIAGIMGKLPPDITPDNLIILGKLLDNVSKLCAGKLTRGQCLMTCWNIVKAMPTRRQPPPPPPMPPVPEKADGELPAPTKGDGEQDGGDSDDRPEGEPGESKSEPDSGQDDDHSEESEGQPDDDSSRPDKDKGEDDDGQDGEDDNSDEVKAEPPLPEKAESLAALVNDDITNKKQLSTEVARAVSDAIVEKRADLTQMVSVLAEHAHDTIVTYTPESSGEETEARKHTQEAENLLRRIFQDYRLRRTEYYRGLYSGKVSNRRLHRAGYGDPRVFQRRDRPEEIDLAVALVMDCSDSMGPHMELVFQIVTAMSDALSKEKVPFIAIGYSSDRAVNIAKFSDSEGGLHLGYKSGYTPSYEGIAAGIAQLLRFAGNRRKILFHYTDGAANSSTSFYIPELLKKARNMGIEDYHLGPSRCVEALYERIVAVEDIAKLPMVVEELLRKEMEK